jgi:hypothetical protein
MFPSFFIVGCGRSGTTLLRNVLCSHPDVLIPPETSFFFWPRSHRPSCPLDAGECRRLVREFRLDATSRLRPGHFLRREIALLGTDWERVLGRFADRPPERRRPVDVFGAIVGDWVRRQDKAVTVVGEKTPHHVFRMPVILASLPEARFIHVVRDPRAVVPSLLEMPWVNEGVWGASMRWRNSVEAARRHAAGLAADRFLEVRYEDLVADLPAVARRVAEFLGLAFDDRMLAPERHGARFVEAQAWHERSRRSLAKDVNQRRQAGLDPVRRRVIESVAGELLGSLGYPPPAPGDVPTAIAAERRIRLERLVASLSPRRLVHAGLARILRPLS